MPTFRFKGFRAASAVALSVGQGAMAANAEVAEWGAQRPTGVLSIDVYSDRDKTTALSLVAPTGIWFEARPTGLGVEELVFPGFLQSQTPNSSTTNTTDHSFHEIFYFWRVTRPAGAASTFRSDLNIPNVWDNRNIAYGKKVAFCFDVPGNYTVECFAVGPTGITATATLRFQSGGDLPAITDPDVAFAGTATVCVNPAGDSNFAWAPLNSQNFSTGANDLAVLDAAYAAFTAGDVSRRLLFKPGVTFNLQRPDGPDGDVRPDAVLKSTVFGARARVYIGSRGGVATLNCGESMFYLYENFSDNASLAMANLVIVGNWQEDTETISTGADVAIGGIEIQGPTHMTFHNVTVRGYAYPISSSLDLIHTANEGRGLLPRLIFSECAIESWSAYGFYANPTRNTAGSYTGRTKLAFIGTRIAKSPNACVPQSFDGTFQNGSSPLRYGYFDDAYLGGCDFFLNGVYNALFRALNGTISGGERIGWPTIIIERTAFEGGDSLIGFTGTNAGDPFVGMAPPNALVDKVLGVGIFNTRTFTGDSQVGSGTGATWRNVTFVQPAVTCDLLDFYDFGELDLAANDQGNAQPVRFHNVTCVYLGTSAQIGNRTPRLFNPANAAKITGGVTFENNVLHAPNITSPINAGPFTSGTLAGFTPRYAGFRDNFNRLALSTYGIGSVANGATFDILYMLIATATRTGRAGVNIPANNAAWQTYWVTTNPSHNCHYVLNGFTAYVDNGRTTGARITASYLSDRIRFTNNTGITLTGSMLLFIDRRGLLPGPDAGTAIPSNLAVSWIPTSSSPAIPSEELGLFAVDDFLSRIRTVPRTQGAFEAAE